MLAEQGVISAQVQYPANKLIVTGTLPPEAVARVVAGLGYGAAPLSPAAPPPPAGLLARYAEAVTVVVSGLLIAEAGALSLALGERHPLAAAYFLLAAAVGGWRTYGRGLAALQHVRFDMNALMTLGVTGAALLGAFGEAGGIAWLYAVSAWLERTATARTRRAVGELMAVAPAEASRLDGEHESRVPAAAVREGDRVRVRPGERFPIDGTIEAGRTEADEAPVTGESVPVPKAPGDGVYAGSLNGAGTVVVRASAPGTDTTLARIVHLVEAAQAAKAPSQAFIDRFAAIYTPIVLVAALLVATVPPAFFDVALTDWIYRGLALLVLACPCALVVSTPVALATAIGAAARRGVLIKGGLPLEKAARIRALAFDKTGTLTEGRPVVQRVLALPGHDADAVLALAAAVEAGSEHPLAAAVVAHAAARGLAVPPAGDCRAHVGEGAEATVEGRRVRVGSARWFERLGLGSENAAALVDRLQQEGQTVLLVADEAGMAGAIGVADALRPAARRVVLALNGLGVRPVVMLTGDHTQTARAIGKLAAVDEVHAGLMPEDKVGAVRMLTAKHGALMMVGDGLNDAPALAAAELGVAMGRGTDVALETADVALLHDDLTRLPYLLRLSRETMAVIQQNVAFSIGIKLLAVAAIAPGWLTLWLAVLADMGATILVTLNALRLAAVEPAER